MKNTIKSVLLAAAFALLGSLSLNAQTYGPVVSIPLMPPGNNTMTPKGSGTGQPFLIGGILASSTVVFDTTGYAQARIVFASNGTGLYAPYAGLKVYERYEPVSTPSFKDNIYADYLPLGAGSVDVSATFTAVGQEVEVGAWTDLDAGAIGDDALLLCIVDPSNSNKQTMLLNPVLQFRSIVTP